jgi:hypothetical protein
MKHRKRASKNDARAADIAAKCPSCGHESDGRFCAACGEDKRRNKNYSLFGHLGEAFKVVTNIESGFLRTFRTLITKPGLLTFEYFAGRRKIYLKPLQLFLFCNIIFFFVQSYTRFNTLSTPLYVHMYQLPYSGFARQRVSKVLAGRGIPFKEYEARFNATIESQAKTLVFLMIPMFALLLQVLYWRPRRYFVEHLVFSIHFFSSFLLLLSANLLLYTLVAAIARRITTNPGLLEQDYFFSGILLLACLTYLVVAVRRAYEQGWALTLVKCLVFAGGLMVILQFYRLCLFFTAFYSV